MAKAWFAAALLALGGVAPAMAAEADFAAAVATDGRAESDVALDASRKPAEVLAFLGLEPGDVALDIFSGGGYYSQIMGRAVGPDGEVIAQNPPPFVRSERAMRKWRDVMLTTPNVLLLPQSFDDFAPGENRFDFALLHLVYHDLYWESERFRVPRVVPAAVLAKLFAAMKPGGVVGVIDHKAAAGGDTRAVVEALHRIDEDVVKADFAAAGFVLDGESDLLADPADDLTKNVFDESIRGETDRFVLRFRKPQ